ncbi:hypothetical protein J1N35_043534 [Gossypium stocksii]|uniref:Uncharacterized protein n=1 Tax=Gossypium stocksii TaxID=47602 RepID=A0A9D3U7F7_9ROSI|nr:hypothetical protein J1N35_043534 [Gossypium stocksii]
MEMFDELVERDEAVEETLAESPHSVVTDYGKRAFDGISGTPPKRRRDNHSFGRGTFLRDCPNRAEVSKTQSSAPTFAPY